MKKLITQLIIVYFFTFLYGNTQQLAFPGAEGFGKYAVGGRTGSVYHVTNLNDSGKGSFRDAVSEPNRIIVFDIGGVIHLNSTVIVDSNLYIAGQTAPGEGITIYGDRVTFSGANNTICRYLRFRMGVVGTSGKDACGIANGTDMIFDHISASWGRDEVFSINWDNKGIVPTNITIQNSIISQGLLTHSAGGLIQTNGGVTLYRNLYVDNNTRNNKVKGVNQYVNNIVYNWKDAAYIMGGDSEGESYVNVENNYFIEGAEDGNPPISRGNELFHIYATDNWFDSTKDGTLNGYQIPFEEYTGGPDFQDEPYDYPELPMVNASDLYDDLIPSVGACLPYRDYADYYVINEVRSLGLSGAFISDESTLPFGAPSVWKMWGGNQRTDSDGDGMPDDWEDSNGTDKTTDDAMVIAANNYANIENFINSITKSYSQEFLRTPLNFSAKSKSQSSITFSWFDYTDNEEGFVLERYINGAFTPIDTVNANSDTLLLSDLQPEEADTFRLYAYKGLLKSDYTDSIVAQSLPVVIIPINPDSYTPDLYWNGLTNNNWDKSSENWKKGEADTLFTDSSKVLFGGTLQGDHSINVTENVMIGDMFVSSDFNYSFAGTGSISGHGSMNKTGLGTLTLGTENTYTGQTVIRDGTLNIPLLANGGLPSSIGSSANYYFNLVFKGGKLNYTGETDTTDRSIFLDKTGELSINESNTTLTMSGGIFTGTGGFVKSGSGTLKIYNGAGNDYVGETSINGGILAVDLNTITTLESVLGTSGIVNLSGGTLQMINGQSSNYEKYDFEMRLPEGTTGGFYPFRNCYIECKVSGAGTLNYTIPYVREYLQGDWSGFTGVLIADGIGESEGSQLLLNNTSGLPGTRVYTTGNTKIVCWNNASTMYLGGLSGDIGTSLACADKQNNAATMTWVVGGANTDETFNGIINNECSSASYRGVTSIVKEGSGIWRLNGNNLYSGTTQISGGTLIVNGNHSKKGAVTVWQEAKLAGRGTIPGIVEVDSGATIEPGDADINTIKVGTLKLNSGCNLNIDIDKVSGTNDGILATDSIRINGNLNLHINGELTHGDEFIIFSADTIIGNTFDSIIPAQPGEDLKWIFTNGVLKVVSKFVNEVHYPKQQQKWSIYPNPVKNNLSIDLFKMYKKINVRIISMNGSIVYLNEFYSLSKIDIDFYNIPAGIYNLNIQADGEQLVNEEVTKQ